VRAQAKFINAPPNDPTDIQWIQFSIASTPQKKLIETQEYRMTARGKSAVIAISKAVAKQLAASKK
jgi:hypothetical protein